MAGFRMHVSTSAVFGVGYAGLRQADPRIAAVVRAALGDARTVLNVGAGAGSYEPIDLRVTAVEPSATMRGQRPAHLPRAIAASAERLPFADASFDAAMATFTVHQWADLDAGLAEVRRVLRQGGRVVLMEPSSRPATARGALRVSRDPRHLLSVSLWRPFSRFHGRFSPTTLAAILEQAGFVNCHVEETLGGLGLLAVAEKPDREESSG